MFSGGGAAKYLIDMTHPNMMWTGSPGMGDLVELDECKASTPYFGRNGQASAMTSLPVYPPEPHYIPATTTRVLHINGDKSSGWHVSDTGNVTELFKVESKPRKPHVRITSSATGEILGTATLHSLSGRIDATVRNSRVSMMPCATLGRRSHVYASPARRGANVTWMPAGHSLDLVCVDERGIVIALFRFNNWSLEKCGKLELIGPVANDGGARMEEVIVTGLAMAGCVLQVL